MPPQNRQDRGFVFFHGTTLGQEFPSQYIHRADALPLPTGYKKCLSPGGLTLIFCEFTGWLLNTDIGFSGILHRVGESSVYYCVLFPLPVSVDPPNPPSQAAMPRATP